jgi:serine/threonine-protein kinase RsbW
MRQSEAVDTSGAAGTNDLVLDFPPHAEHARTARLFAAAVARHFAVDEERIEDLKVAISEAVTNAIKAHAEAQVDDLIRVVVAAEPDGIRFTVMDAGSGFDPDRASVTGDDYTPPSGLNEGTLGLDLIRSLFPTMDIRRNDQRGMTLSILLER